MRVKKYTVNSMPEAMALIRNDLGPNAVILHSEKVKKGGLFGLWGRPRLEVMAGVDTDLRDFPQPTPAADKTIQAMQQELAGLKTAISQMSEGRQNKKPPRVASLDGWYQRLLDQGIGQRLAQQIVQTVADELSRWALDNQGVLNEHLHWYLGRQLPAPTPLTLASGQTRVFFIVGPTGVGKTTTIAKLAANFAHSPQGRARVTIITTDTFRVAAIPQIVAFGEILRIPVEVAYTPQQLTSLVNQNQNQDLILVDTPGRNQRAAKEVARLSDYLSAVSNKTVHLALTAGAKHEDMLQTVEAFSPMSLDGLIFTKIDETASLGAAYTLACEMGLPLSYLTNGQRVPEDIKIATAEYVVDLMVGSVPDELRSTKYGKPGPNRSPFPGRYSNEY
jgi:flagellar biosynthesis protein FlhF